MTGNARWKETGAAFAVMLVLIGLPVLVAAWRGTILPHRYAPGTRIITLTAVANGGIWTQQEITGWNYWWREPDRTGYIALNQGERVVVRVHSVDVLHSFAIPPLRLGPFDVPAGHTVEVKFDAGEADLLMFLCWQWCSIDHPGLRGYFVVGGGGVEK